LARTESQVVASAALVQYTRITEQNRASFHFHGRPESFPLTAVLAVPPDERSGVLLAGRYQGAEAPAQILTPVEVVRELMELVFRVKRFFDLGAVLIGTVTGLLIALVILLSLRLRRREMETMFKLGCSRFTIFRLQAAELSLVAAISLVLAAGLCGATLPWAPALLRQVLLR
jgi:putative ABC transport system permease protein